MRKEGGKITKALMWLNFNILSKSINLGIVLEFLGLKLIKIRDLFTKSNTTYGDKIRYKMSICLK